MNAPAIAPQEPLVRLECSCPPSLNRTSGRHWGVINGWKEKVRRRLRFEWDLVKHRGELTAPARRRVVLTRLIPLGGRVMDEDNLASAMKPILDALKRYCWVDGVRTPCAGLIWEDSPKWIDLERRQAREARPRMGKKDFGTVRVEVFETTAKAPVIQLELMA